MLTVILPEDQTGSQAFWTWGSKEVPFLREKRCPESLAEGGGAVEGIPVCLRCYPALHSLCEWCLEGGRDQKPGLHLPPRIYSPPPPPAPPARPLCSVLRSLLQRVWLEPARPDTTQAHNKHFNKTRFTNPVQLVREHLLRMATQAVGDGAPQSFAQRRKQFKEALQWGEQWDLESVCFGVGGLSLCNMNVTSPST